MILDHTMAADFDNLPPEWLDECRSILERFYRNGELLEAEGELMDLVEHNENSKFGAELSCARRALGELSDAGHSEVGKVAAVQIESLKHCPHQKWRLIFSTEMPKLYQIARRLLVMSTQSADVERVCKAHKVVHTKVRNRLKNNVVHEILHCYVSLRLLKKIQDEKNVKKASRVDAEDQWEDFFEAALIDDTKTNGSRSRKSNSDRDREDRWPLASSDDDSDA
jgi:hypothetical protein